MEEEILLELKKLGENIKKIRTAKGFSRRELAEKCRFRNNYLKRIETGKVKDIKISILFTIAYALQIKLHELFIDI